MSSTTQEGGVLNVELQKSVIDVASRPINAVGVSAATVGTGISTTLEVLPPIIGFLASITGLILSCLLARNYIKKGRLMDIEIALREKELKEEEEI